MTGARDSYHGVPGGVATRFLRRCDNATATEAFGALTKNASVASTVPAGRSRGVPAPPFLQWGKRLIGRYWCGPGPPYSRIEAEFPAKRGQAAPQLHDDPDQRRRDWAVGAIARQRLAVEGDGGAAQLRGGDAVVGE